MPETLAQGEAGGDGESDGALLQGEGQQGGEEEDPDQLQLELCPGPAVRLVQSQSSSETQSYVADKAIKNQQEARNTPSRGLWLS